MAAYLIADIEVKEPEGFAAYRKGVPAVIAAHGGRYLARGGAIALLEGDWPASRIVILNFTTWRDCRPFGIHRIMRR